MAEEIKELIAKIQQEGIDLAQKQVREIIAQAKEEAGAILAKAKLEADKIIATANKDAQSQKDNTTVLLKQAARDTLISLRREINSTLEKIIISKVRESLSPQELGKIILGLVKDHGAKDKSEIIISLKKEDLEILGNSFTAELKNKIKGNVILKASEDIHAGFIISYDSAKSQFEFTDKSLAEYISLALKPGLKEILGD